MTLVWIVCIIALASYLALTIIVARDFRRTAIRSFVLFLLAMLFWQVMATIVSFTTDYGSALIGYRWVAGVAPGFALNTA